MHVQWFFGRDLYKSLTPPRPLGLIETNVGGTPDQHWSSPEALTKCKNLPGAPKWQWPSNFTDSVLWNAKVVPYLKTTILGAIWYAAMASFSFPHRIDMLQAYLSRSRLPSSSPPRLCLGHSHQVSRRSQRRR